MTVLVEIGKALAAGVAASMIVVVFCCGAAFLMSLTRQSVRDIIGAVRRHRAARRLGA